jgi:hypothetical protein
LILSKTDSNDDDDNDDDDNGEEVGDIPGEAPESAGNEEGCDMETLVQKCLRWAAPSVRAEDSIGGIVHPTAEAR